MLKLGEKAPYFEGVTQSGEGVKLSDFAGKKLILYFYPKDNTSGCTLEAKSLRDGKAQLAEMGFEIVGVSPDSVRSHQNFCNKHELNFTLIADTDKVIAEAYGVWKEKSMCGRKYMGICSCFLPRANRRSFLAGHHSKRPWCVRSAFRY